MRCGRIDDTEAGGAFVDVAAERHLRNVLGNIGLGQGDIDDYTTRGVKDFKCNGRRAFNNATDNCMVEIAGARFNNTSIRTRCGRMELPGTTVQAFFEDPVNKINVALDNLLQASTVTVCLSPVQWISQYTVQQGIILTGEFGRSPFLQKVIKERYEPKGFKVSSVNDFTCNAVADGAVIWSATNHGLVHQYPVQDANHSCSRAVRFSYGFVVSTKFDPEMNEHQGCETYVSSEGYEKVIGAWSQLAKKGDTVDQNDVTRVPFNRIFTSSSANLNTFRADLFAYTDEGKPSFAKDQQGKLLDGFRKICTMTADLSNLSGALQEVGAPGKSYWSLTYDLCLRFGGVELSASIEWQEKGTTRTVPVKIRAVDVVYLD